MTEIFDELFVTDDPITEEDRVVHLLASLPDSFNMLVTALEVNSESVPKMEVVTECLLHVELKITKKETVNDERRALAVKGKPKRLVCHFCQKPGHIKRECWKLAQQETSKEARSKETRKKTHKLKHGANAAAEVDVDQILSSNDEAFVVDHVFSVMSKENWIIDSGATCHMCNDEVLYHKKYLWKMVMSLKLLLKAQCHYKCCCLMEILKCAI